METLAIQENDLEKEIAQERSRLSSDRMDISFGEIINLYKNKELIIRPEYQRLYRWNDFQKTALIESILLGIPIPPIFVSEDENGIWELVDGLQRVTTFISFFGELDENDLSLHVIPDNEEDIEYNLFNQWILKAGSLIKNLEGFSIDTLPKKYIINLKRAVCRVEILRGESNSFMKYELFKRLNSGGTKANPQEIRNAIYRQFDTRLNNLLAELSQHELFKKLTRLSEKKQKELYDQELVLRFIAFVDNIENINENTENFLNLFMEQAVKNDNFDYPHHQSLFIEVLKIIDLLEDEDVFRNENKSFVPALYEGIMIGLAQNLTIYKENIELLRKKIVELKTDNDFKKFSGSASNSRSRIKKRLSRVSTIFQNPSVD
jgi:uncharacterized protein with ParB-like and HNH nuclease domain